MSAAMAPALEAGGWPGRQAVRQWPWPAAASLLAHLLAAMLLWHHLLPARSGPQGDAPAMVEVTFAAPAVAAAGPPAPPWVAPVEAPAPPAAPPMPAYAASIPPPPAPSLAVATDLPPPPVLASLPTPLATNLPPPVPAAPMPAPTGPPPVTAAPAPAPAGTPPVSAAPLPAPRATQERLRRAPTRPGSGGSSTAAAAPGVATGAASPGPPLAAAAEGPPLITAPRFRHAPRPPDYPPRAVELDLTGTVVIRALLDTAGDPRELRVQRSSGHPLLDGAALAAVRRWAFEPAARDGRRIEAWVEVPVHFRLN